MSREPDPSLGEELGYPRFAVFCTAYGRREDALAAKVFGSFARQHLSWRLDTPGTAQFTSLLSSPEVAPSHAWLVPIGTHEGAVEVGWDMERSYQAEVTWMLTRYVLRTHMSAGNPRAGPGLCRVVLIRGPTEVVDRLDKLVDAWWSELERWDQFRGAVLFRETEEGRSNLALEVNWLGPWIDMHALEEAAQGNLEPHAERLSVSTWHFRVSALHPGTGGDRSAIQVLAH